MKVSIIIPVYNVEKYIRECLNSIINQTYKNIEIIVVIDGSLDNSSKIVYEFAKKDSRIKVIDRENKGVYESRIDGIKASTGEYLIFVDSDDSIKENMVEVLLNEIISSNTDLVRCKWLTKINNKLSSEKVSIDNYNKILKKDFEPYLYDLLYSTIFFNSMCRQIIKKDVLKNIDMNNSNLKYGEDLAFECKILNNINSFKIIDEYLYIYNIHEDSITNKKSLTTIEKKILDVIHVNELLYEYIDIFNIKNKQKYYNAVISKLYVNITYQLINLSETTKKYSEFKRIMNLIYKEINPKYLKINKNILNLNQYKKIYKFIIKGIINKKYILTYILCTISSILRRIKRR